jgi:hypothetical protein
MPFGFHLTVDTLPSEILREDGSRSALAVSGFRLRARIGFSIPAFSPRPARHYPRLWIWHPSSERQRDFNPPEQRAAQRTICPLLTSDPASPRLSTPVALRHEARSPRVLRTHLHAYACRIYAAPLRASTGFRRILPAHPNATPLSASCSSGQRFAIGLPSDSQSPAKPLPSANTSPCRVCRGLPPPSRCALPGAQKRGAARRRRPLHATREASALRRPGRCRLGSPCSSCADR